MCLEMSAKVNKKEIACKYFPAGTCKYGSECRFKHSNVSFAKEREATTTAKSSNASAAAPAFSSAAAPAPLKTRVVRSVCKVCEGEGQVYNPNASGLAAWAGADYDTCERCNGKGHIKVTVCVP